MATPKPIATVEAMEHQGAHVPMIRYCWQTQSAERCIEALLDSAEPHALVRRIREFANEIELQTQALPPVQR